MFSVVVFYTNNTHHLVQGDLSSSPSNPDFKVQVDAMARAHGLPSSTSWDTCYIEKASVEDLGFWFPANMVEAIPAETPVFRVARDEDPATRTQIRNLLLKESRVAFSQMQGQIDQHTRMWQHQLAAIDRDLARLNRKRSRLELVFEYEVLNRLSKAVDAEAREHLTKEIETLKSASFNWFGYFVDLDTKFPGVGPDVRAIAMKALEGVGETAITQFRLCRTLMSNAGKGGRYKQQHPQPSVEHAKALISRTALTTPGVDVDWFHAIIDRSNGFTLEEEEWDEREELHEQIETLQAEKAGLELLMAPTDVDLCI